MLSSREIIEKAIKDYQPYAIGLMLSGGNDSMTALHVARQLGVKIDFIMHKSEEYGKILLKQKDKQSDNQIKNFAVKIQKHTPYSVQEIEAALFELLAEKVLHIDGDSLCQKRMIEDNRISEIRANAGKTGGEATKKATRNFAKAKGKAKRAAKQEAKAEAEARERKEEAEKQAQEEAARQEAIKPDKEKLIQYAETLFEKVPDPVLSTLDGQNMLTWFQFEVKELVKQLKENIEKM